jgi:4'-phosphopantetheinyl transferase
VTPDVDVAWVDLDPPSRAIASLEGLLTAPERARVARRSTPELRRRATVSLAARRLLAAEVLGVVPADVELLVDAGGRRRAEAPGTASVALSVSTCGDTGVVAIARDREVGVDVEDFDEVPSTAAFATRITTPQERRRLDALEPGARERALLVVWTRKEAHLKATGEGIGSRLGTLEVPVELGLTAAPWQPDGDAIWYWFDLAVPRPALAASLCVGPGPRGATPEAATPEAASPTVRVRDEVVPLSDA